MSDKICDNCKHYVEDSICSKRCSNSNFELPLNDNDCELCKHKLCPPTQEPCTSCVPSEWEPLHLTGVTDAVTL